MKREFVEFCDEFDIVKNALNMRNLIRWNGRSIRNKENLSEHTHLTLACGIQLYDGFPKILKEQINFEELIRLIMIHDSLELLRGDILSITKDNIPGLRECVDLEEREFFKSKLGNVSQVSLDVLELADLKACNEFVKYELLYPNNDFAIEVYKTTLSKFENKYAEFKIKYDLENDTNESNDVVKLSKGYANDAGADIILNKDITFMPHATTCEELDLHVTVNSGEMAYLCERSSAALKGLIVSNCPIDADYEGKINVMVSNISNDIITYHKGESFCQLIKIPINSVIADVRKTGIRSKNKLGSTL